MDDKAQLLALAQALEQRVSFERLFMISALNGDGVDDLKAYLGRARAGGPVALSGGRRPDMPMRLLAAEITREKIYQRVHDELPYSATVETTTWEERKDGSVRIEQTIFVERDSQKAIVLGKGGADDQVDRQSRARELSEILERPVHLFLFVKVREGWAGRSRALPRDGP